MSVDLRSTVFLRVFMVMILCATVGITVSAQTVIASQDFDTPLNLNSQMIDPDGSTFTGAGDMFNVSDQEGTGNTGGLPFAIADDSFDGTCRTGTFGGDLQGFITCSYPDGNFFGVVDLDNGDNMDGMGTVDWAFQIDDATDLEVSIDMAAMGDFENSSDIFNFSYSFDNVTFTPLFSSSVDEAGSQTYTMEDGDMATLSDPLSIDGTTLNEVFQTISGSLTGTGEVLYLHFEATNDGGSEAFAFDNIVIEGVEAVECSDELFISEYMEGSGNNKCVEIYNPTSETVDLAAEAYTLDFYFNGSMSAGTSIELEGTIAPGEVHVVCDNNTDFAGLGFTADQESTASFYNGDDAVVLAIDGREVDVIGKIGEDPGSEWNENGVGTANETIRRKSTVTSGDPNGNDDFDPSLEWDSFASNTVDGLGEHSTDCVNNEPSCSITNVMITEGPDCDGDDSFFSLSFDVAGGSGTTYVMLNPANSISYGVTVTSVTDGTVTVFGQANSAADEGTTAQLVVVDTNNPSCESDPISITIPTCPPILCPSVEEVFINEFHYDNDGGDVNEFVEVAVDNAFGGELSNITLSLYNGSGGTGAVYDSYTLDEFTAGEDDGTFTVYSLLIAGIQNGGPDGLALSCDNAAFQLLSYEGTFTAVDGPAVDMVSTDVGVQEGGDTPESGSLQLVDGEFVETCQNTIGAVNEAITDCCDLMLVDFTIVDESCAGEEDGSISVVAECNTCGDIEYSFDGGETFSDEATAEGLGEDCYTVVIRSSLEDCEIERILIVENDNPTVIPQVEELSFSLETMFSLAGAEIVTYIADNTTAAVTSGDGLQLVDLSDPSNPSLITTLAPTAEGFSADEVSSTAYANGILAAAVPNDDTQMPGDVLFYDMDGMFLGSVTVGPLPDMIKFTPDGTKLLVANEGEPDDDYVVDPEGSISIIDLSGGAGAASVMTADFTAFNGTEAAIEADGGRIFGPGATVAQDLEPEFITVTDDGTTAYVTCQENNLLAEVDIATATVTRLIGLGVKAYCEPGNDLDASNRDAGIDIRNWPFFGFYQPDGIECYSAGGNMYIVSANEGDARDYDGFSEEDRGDDLDLDPAVYPDADELQMDENLGRIRISNVEGDLDDDGFVERITGYGGRSFSIWDAATGDLVFDSGSDLGNISAIITPGFFNANDGLAAEFDERSDDKGVEPEGVTIKEIGGNVYAFIIFERAAGGFAVYNITDPTAPYFVVYIPGAPAGDIAPESLLVIDPDDNPTDGFLILMASEESSTLAVYTVVDNKEFGLIPTSAVVNGGSGVYTNFSWSITGGSAAGEVSLIDEDSATPTLNTSGVTEPGTVDLEAEVTDENGCVTTVTDIVHVVPPLETELAIEDPCSCLDNASVIDLNNNTGGEDGQFAEQVAITGVGGAPLPPGFDFRVTAATGAFDANNIPAVGTQSAGVPIAIGEALTYDPATGYYVLDFVHVDGIGYSITVSQFAAVAGIAIGQSLTIANNCAYPNPVLDPALDEIYCSFETAIALGATDLEGIGADNVTFTVNGNPATEFDPSALGAGTHVVGISYDGAADANGGISPDGGTTPAFPGCIQDAEFTVVVEDLNASCLANVNVTLGEDCSLAITPQMVLFGGYDCADEINITVDGGNSNVVTGCGDHTYMIEVIVAGEVEYTCWGNIFAEDKTDPVLECPDDTDVVIAADFDIQTATGTIDATDPTIELADYSCFLSL
ncbi:MAG: choice-of-anchor I family protein, partial [Bacteroidota bacterium]